ncbi:MAG: glycosyltransferase family 2 protein [Bacteroidota bacterium]|nr:glycosyltransferase family 2 protein [Bacteroidota bacterium]
MHPLVSILLPCYNAESYLKYSLESIINQDYKNIEIICINDGSTDNTSSILEYYKRLDNRIIIINNARNLGLIASLNKSLEYINGEYFARMDADDYSTADRISKQVNFITKNNEFELVSTGYNYFRKNGIKLEYKAPIAKNCNALKFLSLFSPPLNHASILGKTQLIKSEKYYYDEDYPYAEDFEIFSRLVWEGCKITSIPDSLYWIRLNPSSVSVVFNDVQIKTNLKIVKRNISNYLKVKNDLNDHTVMILCNKIDTIITYKEIVEGLKLLDLLYAKSKSIILFSDTGEEEVKKYLSVHKLNIILQANKIRFKKLKYKNIPFAVLTFSLLKLNQYITLIKKAQKKLIHKIYLV